MYTFLDRYIGVIDGKFVAGINHKMNYFSFVVISYPLPGSIVHSALRYKTYCLQLIKFYSLCNNKKDFLFRAKLIYHKQMSRGYEYDLLCKSFMTSYQHYQGNTKYGENMYEYFFSGMLTFDNHVVCSMKNADIYKIIKQCLVKINKTVKFLSCKRIEPFPLPLKAFEEKLSTFVGNTRDHNFCKLSTISKWTAFHHYPYFR